MISLQTSSEEGFCIVNIVTGFIRATYILFFPPLFNSTGFEFS